MARLTLSVLLSFALASSVFGGAFGPDAFENDDALDWVYELEESSGPAVIMSALEPVASSRGYIDAPSCSYAIAAAETLAAMIGRAGRSTPEEVLSWARSQSFEPTDEMLSMAQAALRNVLDENRSELAQLWGESAESDFEAWKRSVASLADRLK